MWKIPKKQQVFIFSNVYSTDFQFYPFNLLKVVPENEYEKFETQNILV